MLKTKFIRKSTILLVLFLFLAFAGCSSKKETELTVYTYSSFPAKLTENIQEKFKTDYKITVTFKSFSDTGPLFNQLQLEKEKPNGDVVIGLDNNYYAKAVKEDLFAAYQPKGFADLHQDVVFDPKCRLIPFDYGYVLFNYNSKILKEIPKSHLDLLKPEYHKKVIIANPMTSSPGQIFLLTTIALYGEEGYLDYWRKLKSNLLTIAPGWEEAYGMYTNGEAPIVLSYGTSPVYHLLYDKTEQYQALVLDNAAYAQIEAAGIIKKSPHMQAAKILMDYLVSTEFQRLIPENQFMYPANAKTELPDSFRIAAKVNRILNLPPEKVAANLERWLEEWEKTINE